MKNGSITIATGPMFSGKSLWLIKNLESLKKENIPFIAIRYAKDNRFSNDSIASKNGETFPAENALNTEDISKLITKHSNKDVLVIDEIQFFDSTLVTILEDAKDIGMTVLAGGLDTDFLQRPWETTTKLMEIADEVLKFHATCDICKNDRAIFTQRLINGKPAPKNDPKMLIGNKGLYSPRCEIHYEKI